jgi:hypothetical protein
MVRETGIAAQDPQRLTSFPPKVDVDPPMPVLCSIAYDDRDGASAE